MRAVHPDVVLFDLDGTLTESGPGVVRSLKYAFDAIGVPPPDDATLMRFVGPPLLDSFRDAGLDDAAANDALVAYRGYFVDKGMFENAVYPGIAELLRTLVDAGRRLAITTSKPLPYALPIVEHFGIRECFEFVCGPDLDGSGAVKTAVVADAMAALKVAAGAEVVLVGDRSHDVIGAHDNGIACIGVLWGYGSRAELFAADAIAADVDELASLLGVQSGSGEEALA
jgi:phosphoglycolate phosphatase